MRVNKLIMVALAASTFAVSGAALAQQSMPGNGNPLPKSVLMAVKHAKISMSKAIAEAEKDTGGKAVAARLISEPGGPIYLISCKNPEGPGAIDVKVDAIKGQVFGEPEKMHIENAVRSQG